MISKKLKALLDKSHIKYTTVTHDPAYTVEGVSHAMHIGLDKVAKSVIVSLDGKLAIAVIPGNKKLDLEALKKLSKAHKADIATESEFGKAFPDCEMGAMPPFGNLYNMAVYFDDDLSKEKEIGFNGGSHSELIKMNLKEYDSLVHPIHGHFTA